jgi:hypothetical protein
MDQSTLIVTPRRISVQGWTAIATAVGIAGALSIPPPSASARDTARRSELLVPAGWEARQRAEEVAASEDELLTPASWKSSPSAARWSGERCSEVIVPADWSGRARTL